MDLFKLFKPRILVVEVEKPRKLETPTSEERLAVLSLQQHPGFSALLRRLRIQRALLEAQVLHERQATLTDSEFLKAGVFWARWLEDSLQAEIKFEERAKVGPPVEVEARAFDEIRALTETIGE